MSSDPNPRATKPKNPFAQPATPPPKPTGAQIFCPACGILVRLPATECPQCGANLRTGEKPEEYVPLWKRGKGKVLMLLAIVAIPSLVWGLLSMQTEEGLYQYLKNSAGLESCVEAKDMWEEFDQNEFESGVKGGYAEWNKNSNSRKAGQDPNGPETPEQATRTKKEKILQADNRSYFASTLMSSEPNKDLKAQDNWYILFPGEWDVAYMLNAGTSEEQIIAGEWNFSWINDGQALQDIMSVPYRWQDTPKGFSPLQSTSTRIFNPKLHVWEGFHIMDGQMLFFRAAKSQDGRIVERYQAQDGPLVVTVYSDFTANSFKATISQSNDNGASYLKVAEIWAKKREVYVP